MSRAIEFLEAHQSPTPSRWREDAQWRRDNEYWLKYARYITLQVLRAMDDLSITQVELAKRMGCTQQYVSHLLKGSSNMTLETIARLENALGIDLVKAALTYVSDYDSSVPSRPQYLSDSAGEKLDPNIKTSALLDGYKHRKK
ncbi:MAG: helix-turn-helix transcriptional regulator [Bacteroidales bacterium]|nr:helix-turn-helix transcriptional regulator [Bacteroidales bacterium]